MHRYSRNRIYITESEQNLFKDFKVLIAGSGIGSFIAECALRLGFEHITIVDGDDVELTNLNRQNYVFKDIGKTKAESIAMRLRSINPNANIKVYDQFITTDNIASFVGQYDIAINALDFNSDVPLKFDEICQNKNIPVLHPYNIGWVGLIFVVLPKGKNLSYLSDNYKQFEKEVVGHVLSKLKEKSPTKSWIESVLKEYSNETEIQSPPQLSIGSFLLAGGCAHLLYKLALNKSVKAFPEFYLFGLEDPL